MTGENYGLLNTPFIPDAPMGSSIFCFNQFSFGFSSLLISCLQLSKRNGSRNN